MPKWWYWYEEFWNIFRNLFFSLCPPRCVLCVSVPFSRFPTNTINRLRTSSKNSMSWLRVFWQFDFSYFKFSKIQHFFPVFDESDADTNQIFANDSDEEERRIEKPKPSEENEEEKWEPRIFSLLRGFHIYLDFEYSYFQTTVRLGLGKWPSSEKWRDKSWEEV